MEPEELILHLPFLADGQERIRGDRVFDGYIYIIEDLWAIHSIDFNTRFQGFKININQLYAPVLPAAWLPVSTKFDVAGSFLGFDVIFNYVAINNDYVVFLNPKLEHFEPVQTEKKEVEEDVASDDLAPPSEAVPPSAAVPSPASGVVSHAYKPTATIAISVVLRILVSTNDIFCLITLSLPHLTVC